MLQQTITRIPLPVQSRNRRLWNGHKSNCCFHWEDGGRCDGWVQSAIKKNCIMWPHQQRQQVFLLPFVQHVPGSMINFASGRKSDQWLDCQRFNLLLLFNKATHWATWERKVAQNVSLSYQNVLSQVLKKVKLLIWEQRCCRGNCSPGWPTCCLVALQVKLCVRLNPSVLPSDWNTDLTQIANMSGLIWALWGPTVQLCCVDWTLLYHPKS